jgi:TetR/AcrR family transcriptional regulator, tetracycline repressor protein
LRPHPELAGLVSGRALSSEAGLSLAEHTLALLRHGGLSAEQAAQVGGYLLNAVAMLVTTEPGREHGSDAEARADSIRRRTASLSGLPVRRYPNVVSSAGVLAACPSPDDYFRLGLDMLIAGVTAITDRDSPPANPA